MCMCNTDNSKWVERQVPLFPFKNIYSFVFGYAGSSSLQCFLAAANGTTSAVVRLPLLWWLSVAMNPDTQASAVVLK